MTPRTELMEDQRRSGRSPRVRRVHCRWTQHAELLGEDRVLSAHRTSAGVATYLRCHCGGLVIELPDGATVHSRPADRLEP